MLYKSLKDEIKGLKNEKALLIKESISASETLAMVREDNRLLQRLGKEHREEIFKLQKKLAEYRDAEEQGLLIKLPCKVGGTVYYTSRHFKEITEYTVMALIIESDTIMIDVGADSLINAKQFGKTVFLTHTEAEAKLKGGANE